MKKYTLEDFQPLILAAQQSTPTHPDPDVMYKLVLVVADYVQDQSPKTARAWLEFENDVKLPSLEELSLKEKAALYSVEGLKEKHLEMLEEFKLQNLKAVIQEVLEPAPEHSSSEDLNLIIDVVGSCTLPSNLKAKVWADMTHGERAELQDKLKDVNGNAKALLKYKEAELGYVERSLSHVDLLKAHPVEGTEFEAKHVKILRDELGCPKIARLFEESLALAAVMPGDPGKTGSKKFFDRHPT